MTMGSTPGSATPSPRGGLRWPQVLVIVIVTITATVGITYWLLTRYIFLTEFDPVQLEPREEQVLDGKLQAIGVDVSDDRADRQALEPEPYSEAGARREVAFSEREVNAMLAKNTDLARKLAIDLSNDLVSAKLLVPLDDDFPILGGKTLRVNAGMELAYQNGRPVIVLKGVSLMGVPVPNAWLGNLKNVDLVREFGAQEGFWKTFANGVEDMHVEDGRLLIKLKE